MKACKIQLSNVDRAPKFDFDDADLLPEDRDVLDALDARRSRTSSIWIWHHAAVA